MKSFPTFVLHFSCSGLWLRIYFHFFLHISFFFRIFVAILDYSAMMQLVNSNGTVLVEREKPRAMRANTLTLRAKRLSHGIKKTVRPVLMSKDEFFSTVINKTGNGNI